MKQEFEITNAVVQLVLPFPRDIRERDLTSELSSLRKILPPNTCEVFLCNFISRLFEPYLRGYSRPETYEPMFRSMSGRSFMPEDLTDDEIRLIKDLINITDIVILKARLNDFVWLTSPRSHSFAEAAVISYLSSAEYTLNSQPYGAQSYIRRALTINHRIKNEAIGRSIDSKIKAALRQSSSRSCFWFVDIVIDYALKDHYNLAVKCLNASVVDFVKNEDYLDAADAYKRCLKIYNSQKMTKKQKYTKIQIGKMLSSFATVRSKGISGSYLVATSFLEEALEYYRSGTAKEIEIIKLQNRIKRYQSKIRGELHEINVSSDITEIHDFAVTAMSDTLSVEEALVVLTMLDGVDTFKAASEFVSKSPLSFIDFANGIYIDEAGRTAFRTGSHNINEIKIYEHAKMRWRFRAVGLVGPALDTIRSMHAFSLAGLIRLLSANKTIPSDHIIQAAKGIEAILVGDIMVALNLTTPLFEPMLRNILTLLNVNTDKYLSKVQEAGMLTGLIRTAQEMGVFDQNLAFEFSGILNEKEGYNIRNKIAHGLITDKSYDTADSYNAVWLFLFLALYPSRAMYKNDRNSFNTIFNAVS